MLCDSVIIPALFIRDIGSASESMVFKFSYVVGSQDRVKYKKVSYLI